MFKRININLVFGVLGLATYYGVYYIARQIYGEVDGFLMPLTNPKVLIGIVLVTIIFELWDKSNRYRIVNSIVFIGIYFMIFINDVFSSMNHSGNTVSDIYDMFFDINKNMLVSMIGISFVLLVYVLMNFRSGTGHARTTMREMGSSKIPNLVLSSRGTERNAMKHMVDAMERNAKLGRKE